MKKLRITIDLREDVVLTKGISEATRGLYLTDEGGVVIPIDLGGGYYMGKPAPCGTWERIDD